MHNGKNQIQEALKNKFPNIKSNRVYQIIFSDQLSAKEKKVEVAKVLYVKEDIKESAADLEEYKVFKSYIKNRLNP